MFQKPRQNNNKKYNKLKYNKLNNSLNTNKNKQTNNRRKYNKLNRQNRLRKVSEPKQIVNRFKNLHRLNRHNDKYIYRNTYNQ